ncbi:MAG: VWA domain-containing protein, partial [candidate division Zixibacteria bacterium]|nr:VWA domain-containing protein [candidate division Zixibacteria bacterium]
MKLWIDFQTPNIILLIFIFAVAFVLAFLSYRFTLPPLKAKKKVLLLVLRWLALTSLFLALGEALLGMAKKSWEKPKIALLLDSSRSMNIKDKTITRKEVLQNLLEEKSFKEVLSKAEIQPYLFSDSIVPYNLSGNLPVFSGEATSIGSSLEKLKENLRGEELTSVILLSDGTNNTGKDPIAIARNYTMPVYTVGIGEFVPFKDLSLEKVEYDEIAYSGEYDTIKVTIKNQGYKGVKIPVLLQENKKVLARKELSFNISGELQETELVFEPEEEGIHRYQVVIPKVEGESFQQDNLKSFTQKVLKKRFNLLLVRQSLNWEFSFLKRYLYLNKDIT